MVHGQRGPGGPVLDSGFRRDDGSGRRRRCSAAAAAAPRQVGRGPAEGVWDYGPSVMSRVQEVPVVVKRSGSRQPVPGPSQRSFTFPVSRLRGGAHG